MFRFFGGVDLQIVSAARLTGGANELTLVTSEQKLTAGPRILESEIVLQQLVFLNLKKLEIGN